MNEDSLDVSSSDGDDGSGDEVYVPGRLKLRVPPQMECTADFNSNIQNIRFKNAMGPTVFQLNGQKRIKTPIMVDHQLQKRID
jgi:hypothetical protein